MVWTFDDKKHHGADILEGIGRAAGGFATALRRLVGSDAAEFETRLAPQAELPTQITPFARTPTTRMHSLDLDYACNVISVVGQSRAVNICLNWLRDQGATLLRSGSLAMGELVWAAPKGGHVLVDLDGLGGIDEAMTGLLQLRLKRPDLIVILLSSEFARHDFGQERLALCDVSLRVPCSFSAFELALTEAEINNWAWADRLAETGDGRA